MNKKWQENFPFAFAPEEPLAIGLVCVGGVKCCVSICCIYITSFCATIDFSMQKYKKIQLILIWEKNFFYYIPISSKKIAIKVGKA